MKVDLTPQQEAELTKLAESKGRNADQLAQDVLDYYLKHEARFVGAVNRGLRSLDEGNSISHKEAVNKLIKAAHDHLASSGAEIRDIGGNPQS